MALNKGLRAPIERALAVAALTGSGALDVVDHAHHRLLAWNAQAYQDLLEAGPGAMSALGSKAKMETSASSTGPRSR